jgi:predicted RNase H-like nuclease (RuvC/YqgF family)
MDKQELVEFLLKNYYIQENEAQQLQINWLQVTLYNKNKEIESLSRNINQLNNTIARLQTDILYYQRLIHRHTNVYDEDQDLRRTLGFDNSDSNSDNVSDTESEDLITMLFG